MGEQFTYSRLSRSILLATGLTLAGSHAMASGFRIPEISTVGTATSNALVANTTETGALAYNPAAMSFHDANAINAGITRITYEPEVTPDVGTATSSTGEDTFWIPNGYFMVKGHDNMSFGLAVNAPFGLETKWPRNTFGGFGGPGQALAPELSRIKMFNVNPNIAWQLDDTSSIAFGINYYDLDELVFNTQDIRIKGRGGDLGWNIAYQKKMDKLTFGASYRSAVEVDVSGFFDATNAGTPPALAATAKLEFPDMFQAGIHYQVTDRLGVELDIERTGWSSFDKISIVRSDGAELTSSINNWDDTWAYRLGAIYQMNPKTKLMFGYSADETPQPDEYFSARVPDDDRQLFSLGMTHDFGNWNLELAYMLVDVDDRDINSTDAYAGAEANGTDAYNGTYKSDSDLISVGISMKF
ncbi:OmpP1/FadL family transporter [Thiohalophilus sp.]|uniref:OmpP1/FadL family transporter n=1 Tax=Thiohalophilus sp. TaxID=3028392 RepID=UPI002ACE65CA|nr:porin [Thiohalophilus sp.]MDZ7802826.1 porin [Thiohalophilus sp.]